MNEDRPRDLRIMWLTHHQLRYHRTRFRVEAPSRPPSSRDCDTMGGIRSAAHAREARGSGEGRRGMGGERGEWEGGGWVGGGKGGGGA